MFRSRWRKRIKFWGVAFVLCALGVMMALALSRFFNAFYSNIPLGYEPKDSSRGKAIEQSPTEKTGQ